MAKIAVAPLVGAWIEMYLDSAATPPYLSLPSWERGLKSVVLSITTVVDLVAPLVGAWIEIQKSERTEPVHPVAPLVGAWIEIFMGYHFSMQIKSLPSWERGLKLV